MKHLLLFVLTLVLLNTAWSQDFTISYTAPEGYGSGAGEWVDQNNDGKLDIYVSGTFSSTIPPYYRTLFYNGDGAGFNQYMAGLTGLSGGSDPGSVADIDNDGDLDVFIAGYSGTSQAYLYENNGGTYASIGGHGIEPFQQGSVAWGDYNNDGFKDLLVTGWGSTSGRYSRIYKNNGDKTFSDAGIALPGFSLGDVAWADYNNDGFQDFVLCGYNGSSPFTYIQKSGRRNIYSGTYTGWFLAIFCRLGRLRQ